ncbi:MAG: hypothetical protein A2015_06525 [Spirochaetes bacterium GWF1_31_7]|nr:MAG: hypothetical protein A2Y30_08360 [Spirochaetes bacterium GWE1_32_154]OHD51400.1 MAG: hypothetical protein A2Y29_14745 [Spirochaetes bacterium GWE2_31_10]OHD53126.1 MAG: hypothetical protein A2015_06525 [Spirochaetes bacterium GWF1_31_7]OHD82269.1 MAG: hypothetical protein A2355_01025 [Spirochaetes bacterium RIFOXYB1_FULL_32_8]HBD94453.1 two-component system response regulator [Spirochaetia bacterium]
MNNLKVLIIDDEELIRESLCDFLVDLDYTVGLSSSGEEGLHEIKTGDYDIAIIDMTLPDMNGEEFIEKAHVLNQKIKFIVHTGYTGYSPPENLIKIGITNKSVLIKPVINMQNIITLIEELVKT